MKLSQCDTILKAMLENKHIINWTAKDFQSGKYFVGYEATARMSELLKLYPDLFIIKKDGRIRMMSIDWNNEKEVKKALERVSIV